MFLKQASLSFFIYFFFITYAEYIHNLRYMTMYYYYSVISE